MSSPVLTAAIALDSATAAYISALGTYLQACSTANATYRIATPQQSNARLDSAAQQARAALLSDGLTAGMLERSPISPAAPSLASQHAND